MENHTILSETYFEFLYVVVVNSLRHFIEKQFVQLSQRSTQVTAVFGITHSRPTVN